MLNSALGRLRLIGVTEGVSYIVLLFVAMPLKYLLDMPEAVRWTGWAHGALFTLYIPAVLHAAIDRRWSLWDIAVALGASLVPFGTFALEPRWRREQLNSSTESAAQVAAD